MSYRLRAKGRRKFNQAAMQAGRERARMARPLEDRPPDREGVLLYEFEARCFEFGAPVEHRYQLYGTSRCDCFRVVVDGQPLPKRMGRSKVHELMRKAFPRVLSARSL